MTIEHRPSYDLAKVREQAGRAQGKQYWRCLEELAGSEEFQQLLDGEFPAQAADRPDAATRRQFLGLMGASLALAGLSGCDAPRETIVPYVEAPEEITPGKPLFFATAMTLGGVATGLLVEQHMGRPTKVEGNPDHPASLGATDAFSQASVLTLYDPDRSREVIHLGVESSWPRAAVAIDEVVERARASRGAGLRILTETITSPTLAWQLDQLLRELPEARWVQYEPVTRHAAREGARLAFGEELDVIYNLGQADVILALDADFLDCGHAALRYAREFADRRRVWRSRPEAAEMNRLYAVGPTPSPTSAVADHRLSLRAADVSRLARLVADRLGVDVGSAPPLGPVPDEWLTALVEDLRRHRGRSLVIAGDYQPPFVHALAHAINDALGNIGETVSYIPSVYARPVNEMEELRELTDEMLAGDVEALLVLGANPVFSAPADVDFARAMENVPFRLHLGLYYDETAELCHWHLPEAHFLESWGDARAYNGAVSLIQPLIAPLYNGRTALELVARLNGRADASAHELLREFWREQWRERDEEFEQLWTRALHDGVIEGTAFSPVAVELQENWRSEVEELDGSPSAAADALEIVFRPDPTIYDGRFANNAWLQELPKPLTKITWDNVAVVGPKTAEELGLSFKIGDDGGDIITDMVRLHYRGRTIEAPAWILPGHAEGAVTVYFGYGRTNLGRVGQGIGFNPYRVRLADRPWFDDGLEVRKTGRRYQLAATQLHHLMYGRDIVHTGTLEEYRDHPHSITKPKKEREKQAMLSLPIVEDAPSAPETEPAHSSMYPEFEYARYKWGMVIDQTVCIGCKSCVVACQAENNIPVVGKEEVARGREMHWLRVDAYYEGEDATHPEGPYFQPVPCMHCEKAPCELVCPVNATVHSDEGLNDMNYARCVGTRYCSNNCPYKVRRFNFFEYANWENELLKPLRNPEVTVRSRGVMEKCTYCVQRINQARMHAEKEDRPMVKNREGEWVKPIYENELMTACQAACPTQAIVFGDLNDPNSQVSKMRCDQPLQYGLMADHLGTQPRTTYLAALRNPNSEITHR